MGSCERIWESCRYIRDNDDGDDDNDDDDDDDISVEFRFHQFCIFLGKHV